MYDFAAVDPNIEDFINIFFSSKSIDKNLAKKAIETAYLFFKEPIPEIFFFSSPLEARKFLNDTFFSKQDYLSLKDNLQYRLVHNLESERKNSQSNLKYLEYSIEEKIKFVCELLLEHIILAGDSLWIELLTIDFSTLDLWLHGFLKKNDNDNAIHNQWNILNKLYQECPFILTFNKFCIVIDRPCEIHIDRELLLHAEGKAAIRFRDGYEIYCNHGVSIPSEYGKVYPSCWKPSWILTKSRTSSSEELINNCELMDILLTSIGYRKFCQELPLQKHLYWENYQALIMRGIDRIEDWQYFYYYDFYKKEDFTGTSIDSKLLNYLIKDLNFRVSAELCYLYLIYDGGYQLAPKLYFYPLKQAIDSTTLKLESCILPLFHGDRQEIYYVLCDNAERMISPVYCQFPDEEPVIYAECVTSLIVTIAQCYQEGAYYIAVDEETGARSIEQNLDAIEPIFEKFNPDQIDNWRKIWKG